MERPGTGGAATCSHLQSRLHRVTLRASSPALSCWLQWHKGHSAHPGWSWLRRHRSSRAGLPFNPSRAPGCCDFGAGLRIRTPKPGQGGGQLLPSQAWSADTQQAPNTPFPHRSAPHSKRDLKPPKRPGSKPDRAPVRPAEGAVGHPSHSGPGPSTAQDTPALSRPESIRVCLHGSHPTPVHWPAPPASPERPSCLLGMRQHPLEGFPVAASNCVQLLPF